MKPLSDRILVKKLPTETVSAGGILIPEAVSNRDPAFRAKVVALGPGAPLKDGTRRPIDLQVGDVVLIGRYEGHEVKLDGEDHLVVTEGSVLGIVTEG